MQTLKKLYRIGRGPSSSHTIAPERACKKFMEMYPSANKFGVILYGSLALTGKGHGTDIVINKTFYPKKCEITFDKKTKKILHPNTMDLFAYENDTLLGQKRIYSIGGGAYRIDGENSLEIEEIYKLNTFKAIKNYCEDKEIRIYDYVREVEGDEIFSYLKLVWEKMKESIKNGLKATGVLPGGLNLQRKARLLFRQHHIDETPETEENRVVCAYAFAVSEQNASGETIVTAPTCGSSGVVPSVLYYMQKKHNFKDEDIINALASAGIIGNLVKQNASISGAECGCQAEIGTATSMASAALAELFKMDIDQIEYAAEISMEHQLGLTCDPVKGLVQIPCIERNAVAAMRAINALSLCNFLSDTRKVSFDDIVATMYRTGIDLSSKYKETSRAGLAYTLNPRRKGKSK